MDISNNQLLQEIDKLLDKKLDQKFEENNQDLLSRITIYIDQRLKEHPTREEFEKLQQAISLLPTKDQYFKKMDKIAGQYKEFSTEAPNLAKKQSAQEEKLIDHESRLSTIEASMSLA